VTTQAFPIGLTYGGTDVQDLAGNGIFLYLKRGYNEPATVRGADVIVPGRIGRIPGVRVKDSRSIVLEGLVTGVGTTAALELSSFRSRWTTFAALFDLTTYRALVATLEDASTKTIQARTLNIAVDQAQSPMMALVSVELEATSPDWT
jgi:hypothetical protein